VAIRITDPHPDSCRDIRIRIATPVRRALAELSTVPVLLVTYVNIVNQKADVHEVTPLPEESGGGRKDEARSVVETVLYVPSSVLTLLVG